MLSLLPLVIQYLPSIAGALISGGKGEALGRIAGEVAREVFGTDDPAEVQAKAEASPEALEHFKAVLAAQTAEIQAEIEDRQGARNQTVQLAQAGSAIAWGAPVISTIVALGFVLFSYLAVARPSGTDRDVIMYLLGAWNSAFVTMLSYWLGSSQGSRRKDDQLAALAQSATTPSPVQIVGRTATAVTAKRKP